MADPWEAAPVVEAPRPAAGGGANPWDEAPVVDAPAAAPPAAAGISAGLAQIPGQAPTLRVPAPTRPKSQAEEVKGKVASALDEARGIGEMVSEFVNQAIGAPVGMAGGFVAGMGEMGLNALQGKPNDPMLLDKRMQQGAQVMTTPKAERVRNPVSEVGQERIEQMGGLMEQLPAYLGHMGPAGGMAASAEPAGAMVRRGGRAAAEGVSGALDRVLPKKEPTAGTAGSVGAAATDMATQRRERAADLPVPVRLSEGDATRDYAQQRFEKETAKDPEAGAPLREAQADKTEAVTKNFENFVEQTGASTVDKRAVGENVVDPIFEKAEAAKREIKDAYKKADEAGETAEQVPYAAVVSYVNEQTPTVREKLAPIIKMVEEQLQKNDPEGSGSMSISALEDVRKAIRANTEFGTPNSVHGGELIRRIDQVTAGAGGELYQQARKLYRDYAAEFKNQGVIRDLIGIKKGTVDRKVAFEDVFDRSVMRGSLDDLTKVKDTLISAGPRGEQAWRDMRGTALEHIRKQVFGNDSKDHRGQVVPSSAKFGKVLEKLDDDGKLDFLFGKRGAAQLRDLREIVSDIYTAPAGAVNTSGTASVLKQAFKQIADMVLTFTATSAAGMGLPVPALGALKLVADKIRSRKTDKLVQQALGDKSPLPPSTTRAFEETPAPPPVAKPAVSVTSAAPSVTKPPESVTKPAAAAPTASAGGDPRLTEIARLRAGATPEVARVLDQQAKRISAELREQRARTERQAEADQLERKAAETLDPEIRAALIKRANTLRPDKVAAGEAKELATTPTAPVKAAKIPAGKARELTPEELQAYETEFFAAQKVSVLEQQRVRDMDRAIDLNPEAVYAAAVQHENSPGALDRAIGKIIEEGERRADEGKQAAVADAAVSSGASGEAGRGEPVVGRSGPDRAPAPGAERSEAVQPGRQAAGSAGGDARPAAGSGGDQPRQAVGGPPEAARLHLDTRRDVSQQTRQAIIDRYYAAQKVKPAFDERLKRARDALGDAAFELKLPEIKGPKRATDKIVVDYAGDASRIKDLVRGTIVIRDIDGAASALKALHDEFGELEGLRNGLDPAAAVGADGYRDIKANVIVDGMPTEVQVNVPEMIAAKKEAHPLMTQRDALARTAKSEGRDLTPQEGSRYRALDERMRGIYAAAWDAATMRRNSASSTARALRENESSGNLRGSGPSQARSTYSADRTTGTPSTSQKSEPSGKDSGSDSAAFMAGTSKAILGDSPIGRETIATTERGMELKVRYRLVDAGDLVTSHDNALRLNPLFDQTLQPRDRERMSSEAQIAKIENSIKPELLADSWKASDGAPIIGADGMVESGNARTIALRRAYASGKAADYKAWLEKNAGRFGLNPEDVTGIDQPVLVREGLGKYDRAEFARQANESAISVMSETEQARSDAQRLPDLEGLMTSDDGALNLQRSGEFVREFMRTVVSDSERNAMMTKDGHISQRAAARIRNAVFAKAYDDPDLVAMLTESTDSNVKNVLAGMLRAAFPVARIRDMLAAGARQGNDFTADLVDAVRRYAALRQDGMTVADYLSQGSLIGGEASPGVATLMRDIETNSRAPKRIAELIESKVNEIEQRGDPRQSSLLE